MIFIALITLFGGYLMKIYAWKTILGNEGVINSILIYFHIIKEPLTFLLYTHTFHGVVSGREKTSTK